MSGLEAVSGRLARGEQLSGEEAALILDSRDVIAIGALADDARRRVHGGRTSFVRVLEVHVDAVPSAAPARMAAGEIRISGRPSSLEAAVTAVRAVRGWSGSTPVTGFSLPDLRDVASDFDGACRALADAGLDAVAEVPVDQVDDATLVARARAAGLAARRMTVNTLEPHGRVSLVERARDLQAEAGGFHAFAPLPRTTSVTEPTTGYDDVKLVALARLVVSNVRTVQVDWPLYGPKLAQVALTVGADDVDGVAAVEQGLLGARRSALEEILTNIRAAGLEPWERDARFEALA